MSIPTTAPLAYTPEQFTADAREILDQIGENDRGFAAVAAKMRLLAAQPGIIDEDRLAGLHGAAGATILVEDEHHHCALMLARFPSEAPTPIHNHNSWGIVCVVRGRDLYQRFERLDDGGDPARAELRLAEERVLETGDVVWFGPPPHDIHAQQGIGDAAWELVLFGTNPTLAPRAYFDLGSGHVHYDDSIR
ncbi:MAG: hypothetical protein ACKOWF_11875 [Chloroflexota bacterium]